MNFIHIDPLSTPIIQNSELKKLTEALSATVSQQNNLRNAQTSTTSHLSQLKTDVRQAQDDLKNVNEKYDQLQPGDFYGCKFCCPGSIGCTISP